MQNACVFVDGENLRHSIVDLFPASFRKEDYLPKDADWQGFFDWVVTRVDEHLHRVRTYWYMVESIDFFPYHFPSVREDPEKTYRLLSKHTPYSNELQDLGSSERQAKMEELVKRLKSHKDYMKKRFDGWQRVQDGIAKNHKAIEFRRAGAIKYDLFEEEFKKEKGVDVKLATDLIMLRDIYDVAVIISGDQDYVPAVQVVKDSGKRVINASFMTHKGRELPGGAWRLGKVTDHPLKLPFENVADYLKLSRTDP